MSLAYHQVNQASDLQNKLLQDSNTLDVIYAKHEPGDKLINHMCKHRLNKGVYNPDIMGRFSKHKRQLKDYIIQL